MIPHSTFSLPEPYRTSDMASEGSSEHTVRVPVRERSDSGSNEMRSHTRPGGDVDFIMRDDAATSQQPQNSGTRWFSNLDPHADDPTGYHTTAQPASTSAAMRSSRPMTSGLHLAPLNSIQSHYGLRAPGQQGPEPDLITFSPINGERAISERAGPSGANGVNILNPLHAPRASSDPGQGSSQWPGYATNTQAHDDHHERVSEPPEPSTDESSDNEPPVAGGVRYNIPPNHLFRHDNGGAGSSHSPARNAAPSQPPHQQQGTHHHSQANSMPQPPVHEQHPGSSRWGMFGQPNLQGRGPSGPPQAPFGHSMGAQDRPMQPDRHFSSNEQSQYTLRTADQPQSYVTMNQFASLQQSVNQGFQSLASLVMAQRPMTLCERQPRTRASRTFMPLGPKLHDLIQHRNPPTNTFHESIRKHFDKLLGPDPLKVTVRPEESTAYATIWLPTKGRACLPSTNVATFRIDIAGLPRGPWNQSAADVFTVDYLRERGETAPVGSPRWHEIRKQALNRCESLKAAFVRKHRDDRDAGRGGKQRRSSGRQGERFRRRLKGARHFKVAPDHIKMLQFFGREGMSSDESEWYEPEDGPSSERCPRYWIHRPKWRRHSVVTSWLRIFDSLYQMYRNSKTDRRGARIRRRGDKHPRPEQSTKDTHVPGLPINAYDEQWMADPTTLMQLVNPQGSFLFQHHPDILESVRRSRVRSEYD